MNPKDFDISFAALLKTILIHKPHYVNNNKVCNIPQIPKFMIYCNAADVPYMSSHKIRFTSCSLLYNGENLTQVSRLMGYSEVATTLHYLRNVNDSHEILDSMEKAFAVTAPSLHQEFEQ